MPAPSPAGAPAPAPARGQLGLIALTALVVGNMVGSGVFLLPASLAPYGGASLLGWVVSAGGSLLLGLTFARLARRSPAAAGPYAYTREAFGEFAAFLVGWGYWISCWAALASIAVAMVGYLGDLVPAVGASTPLAAGCAIATIVLLTGVNLAGVRQAGAVQVVTTILKLLPLVAVALFGFSRFERAHLEPFVPTGQSLFPAAHACLALTLWAFQGFESASVAAGEARAPTRDVPRATLIGIAVATTLYVASTLAVMGMVPRADLAASSAPFADAARLLWGPAAGKLVAVGAFVSCFGALNGWILVTGQLPMAIAGDGLFPRFFGRLSGRGTPALGLIVSSALACTLVVANYSGSLVTMFTGMILLSTLATLVPYTFCAMAELTLTLRQRRSDPSAPVRGGAAIALSAFGYGLLAVGGAGQDTVYWGFLLLMSGIPFYVWARSR